MTFEEALVELRQAFEFAAKKCENPPYGEFEQVMDMFEEAGPATEEEEG